MTTILTLTLNPAMDVSSQVDAVEPTKKLRTHEQRSDPGGGGINVARVLTRLGQKVTACYLAGGATGAVLAHHLDSLGIDQLVIPIEGETRISVTVFERRTGSEYRFVAEGPCITDAEAQACIDTLTKADWQLLVLSGSLPPCTDPGYYNRIAEVAAERGARVVLDTSGEPLKLALAAHHLWLVKPSIDEFEELCGQHFESPEAVGRAAVERVRAREAQYLVISMGKEGVVFADATGFWTARTIAVEAKSAVGAGDSFLAALLWAMLRDYPHDEALKYGIAGGTAAILTPGTELCRSEDVARLFHEVPAPIRHDLY